MTQLSRSGCGWEMSEHPEQGGCENPGGESLCRFTPAACSGARGAKPGCSPDPVRSRMRAPHAAEWQQKHRSCCPELAWTLGSVPSALSLQNRRAERRRRVEGLCWGLSAIPPPRLSHLGTALVLSSAPGCWERLRKTKHPRCRIAAALGPGLVLLCLDEPRADETG